MRSRERENAMNSDFRDKLSNAATVVEITLGMVILIACIVSGIGMVAMTDMNKLFGDPAYLQARMSSACFKPLYSNTVTLPLFADFPLGKSVFLFFTASLRRFGAVFRLCCSAAAYMPLLLVHLQNGLYALIQLGIQLLQARCDILMYG